MSVELLNIYEESSDRKIVEDYLESKKECIEKYGKDLPEPSESLKVAIVVPILAEYANGNFWRLVRGMIDQKDISNENFEVICVINNSNAVAEKASSTKDIEDEEVMVRIYRFLENQINLFMIETMRAGQEDFRGGKEMEQIEKEIMDKCKEKGVELTEKEMAVVKTFLSSKVNVLAVDCSSLGRGLRAKADESPAGIAVDIGTAVACGRLVRSGDFDGLIAVIDGDYSMTDGFFREMFELMEEGAEMVEIPLQNTNGEDTDTDKGHVAVSPVLLSKVRGFCRSNAHGNRKFVEMARATTSKGKIARLQRAITQESNN